MLRRNDADDYNNDRVWAPIAPCVERRLAAQAYHV